jgi:hypothetical protein
LNWSRLAAIRTVILVLAGFALVALGAWLIFPPAGWIIAGVALVLLAAMTDPDLTVKR